MYWCCLLTAYPQLLVPDCQQPAHRISVLQLTCPQHLMISAVYCHAASRCYLLPSSISVLPPTTPQHLGAAYSQAASRCCHLLPRSISVLPGLNSKKCPVLIVSPKLLYAPLLLCPLYTPKQHLGAAAYYPTASRCCLLPSSISVLPPTAQQPLGAAYYPAASRCCLLPSSISVLPPTAQQHPGAAY